MARWKSVSMIVAVVFLWMASSFAGLQEYVDRPDDSYAYSIHSTAPIGEQTVQMVNLTSQTWQGIVWKHWLAVIVPKEVKHPDQAMLMVMGGGNRENPPDAMDSDEARALSLIAARTGTVVAVLMQVPNQPLFDGLNEDALISYTYEKYLRGEGEDWPLLFPMVKSAVRAMDAIQAVAKEKNGLDITEFCVTGASKRGWTTWLTGASDPRVKTIIPMVIDVLCMDTQMEHQLKTYGSYSNQIDDYTNRGIQALMGTPEGQKLLHLVDPYRYRDKLTMPKLIVLGTNDEYWCVDSANLYFNGLAGPKYLRYEPNAGHGLSMGIVPTVISFYNAFLNNEPLPEFAWNAREDGSLEVTWKDAGVKPTLWQAQSPNRDFRQAQWTGTPLEGDGRCEVKVDTPAEGWTAFYVELLFPGKDGQMSPGFCTQMTVLPERFPEHPQQAGAQPGTATQ